MSKLWSVTCVAMLFGMAVQADVLELKNGQVINGKFAGGTAGTIRFETTDGVQVVETAQVISLTFTTTGTSPAAAPAPAAMAVPPAPGTAQPITIPAGTPLLVRMMDGISSSNKEGTRFTTTLEQDLVINGRVAVKAGTKIYGDLRSATKAGRAIGRSSIDIRLSQIAMGSEMPLISTSSFTEKGSSSGKKTAGGALVGAGIGAVVDGGDGAGKGAAIGAGASLLKKGETVTIPPNALLEFQLTQALTIKAAQ